MCAAEHSDQIDWDRLRSRIEHVVVLMLENRSFDHLLGNMDHPDPAYERPQSGWGNHEDPTDPNSPFWAFTDEGRPFLPLDPDHSHHQVMTQLGLSPAGASPNSGFARSYLDKAGGGLIAQAKRGGLDLGAIVMGGLQPHWSPAVTTLAKEFALCTRWFSSVPGETWPNRNFLHAATSDKAVDIELGIYSDKTIFEVLDSNLEDSTRKPWTIYFDGPAQVMAFAALLGDDRIGAWRPWSRFQRDVAAGELASYTFIEPNHSTPGWRLAHPDSNSQHPANNLVPWDELSAPPQGAGSDFRNGDALVASVYGSLRSNPALFAKTLLIVTYDEHGGLYDHVPSPRTTPPGDPTGWLRNVLHHLIGRGKREYAFRHLGVRVPAILVSPWIRKATLESTAICDHASVPRFLRELFVPDAVPLTQRDATTGSFASVFNLDQPRDEADLPLLDQLEYPEAPERSKGTSVDARSDHTQQSLDALALIVGDHLDHPQELLRPDKLEISAPSRLSTARVPHHQEVEDAMKRFEDKAAAHASQRPSS